MNNYRTNTILAFPIKDVASLNILGVVEAINKF
jgi:hypothetical protein